MTEQITVPRETWDAVVEALQIAHNITLVGPAYSAKSVNEGLNKICDALTAANAVSEAQPAGPEDMAIYKSIADGYLTKVQPVDEWTIRGTLSAKLKCWHRLKEDEASELVRLFAANAVQPQAQVGVLPIEGSEAADNAIHSMLCERQWPSSSINAARAGWRAARLFAHPQATEPHNDLLRMLANRARNFPNYPLGYHIPEVFAAIGEQPPEPQTTEPAGWKLVPVEPTQEMIEAFHTEYGESACNKWDAMLAAAPEAK